jgi:hypothetical protein
MIDRTKEWMEKRRMECTAALTEIQRRGPAPVPPRFFAFKKMAKSRWLYFSTTSNVAYATFTVKRSGCASAEPYPQNRKFMVARVLLICYSYFKTSCDNGHKLTKKNNWIYILTLPCSCPKNGDPLKPSVAFAMAVKKIANVAKNYECLDLYRRCGTEGTSTFLGA